MLPVNQPHPAIAIVSLEDHLKNGPIHESIVVAMIMSMKTVTENDNTIVQQRHNTTSGKHTQVRYQRRLLCMCVCRSLGSNMFMIFNGNGNTPCLFDCDVTLQYDGMLRKFLVRI